MTTVVCDPHTLRRRPAGGPRVVILCLWLLGGSLAVCRAAWAQSEAGGRAWPVDVSGWLAQAEAWANDPTVLRSAGYVAGGIVVLWVLTQIPRLLRWSRGSNLAPLSPAQNRREARRAARRGDHLEAGRLLEAAEDWEDAAAAYERGRAFAEAAAIWERQNQPAKAARLYEQATEYAKAGEMYTRVGNHAKAAGLYQKGGQEMKAAGAYERAGDLERAATLYARHEAYDRAAELRQQLDQPGPAAELFERSLKRLRVRQEGDLSAEAAQARQGLARRCGELYARADQPAKAAAILQEHGLEVEAAEQYCRAGEWETGLRLFVSRREFDRAEAVCRAQGAEKWLQVVEGERLAASGREADAGKAFEAGQMWWRAAELYDRSGQHAKAAEIYARQGDEERAAEMHAAAGDLVQAAAALERLGKWKEAAQYYQRAGEIRPAARALQSAGDCFGAGSLLVQADALDEAMALFQQVGPESEHYLEATIALGDIFLRRDLDGPAKEKFEKAVALRPIAPDFVHPTYQLAVIVERQGDLREALRLFEKVMAERFDYQDIQARVADLRQRLTQTIQVISGPEATQVVGAPSRPRYRIVKELGRGGMGIVYRAEDEILQRPVAYKVMPSVIREDAKALEYFLREARIAASLQHPNIVTIYDAGQTTEEVYIAMEYVEGRSLQEILDEVHVLPPPRALGVFRQACLGLAHAHSQKIVHRDVKPANMMVTAGGVVKLMDFGLAAVVTQATAKVTSVRGTPFYMAPEQILGEDISALSDQYSLGCTLYHMLTGRPPFVEGDVLYHHIHSAPASARKLNPQVPTWLDAIILRTMLKDRTQRFPSVAALVLEVERCLASARTGPVARDASR